MITALSASPSLDVTYLVDSLVPGEIHRPSAVVRVAGGKTLNAARAATILGADVTVVALLGGALGDAVQADAEASGVTVTAIPTESGTRSCVSISPASPAASGLTEVYEHPSAISASEWTAALDATAAALADRPGWLVVSGGMPASLGAAALGQVLEAAGSVGARVALDSHGPALAAALDAVAPDLLKINRVEAAEVLVLPVDSPLLELATGLRRRTSGAVVVTDGVDGALGIDDDGTAVHVSIPARTGAFPVGSGDSFLGALVVALDSGESLASGMRMATAAATANAMVPGAAVFSRASVDALVPEVLVVPARA